MDNNLNLQQDTAENTKPIYDRLDAVIGITVLVCGFLFCHIGMSLALGTTLFAALLFTVSAVYIVRRGHKLAPASYVYLVIAAASALYFTVGANEALRLLNFPFLIGLYALWLASACKTDTKLFHFDLLNQFFPTAFCNIPAAFAAQTQSDTGKKRRQVIFSILIGVLISVFLLSFILPLLISSDGAFENLMKKAFAEISDTAFTVIVNLMFGIPIGAYIFAMLYGNARNRHADKINADNIERFGSSCKVIPCATVFTVLSVICAVYVLYFLSQTSYFLSAFESIRPESYTYAEYARKGFFELCIIAFINLCIIYSSDLFAKRSKGTAAEKALKIFSCVFSVFTLFFIAIAISKMVMYIQNYGFTQLRAYTSWVMITLAVVFVFFIVRQFKKFNISRAVFILCSVSFLALCWCNCDALIARYNIEAYESQALTELDVDAFDDLSDDAVPVIADYYVALEERGDENQALIKELRSYLLRSAYPYLDNESPIEYNYNRVTRMKQVGKLLDRYDVKEEIKK